MRRAILFTPLILCIILGVVFFKGLSLDPTELPSAKVGKQFPSFSLQSLNHVNRLVSQNDIKGEVRLVNIWATWCPTCKREHDFLYQLSLTESVEIIGVNYKDDRQKAIHWLKRYQDPYVLNIFDEEGRLGLDLGVYGAPETYIIDKQGIIHYRHVGEVNAEAWDKLKPVMESLGWKNKIILSGDMN